MTPPTKNLLCALLIPPQCVLLFLHLARLLQFGSIVAEGMFEVWLLWVAIVNGFCIVPGLLLYALFELLAEKGPGGSMRLLLPIAITMVVGGAIGFAVDEATYVDGSSHPSFLSKHLYLFAGLTAGLVTGGTVSLIGHSEPRSKSVTTEESLSR